MKALALVDSADHVCARYRIGAFEAALNRAGVALQIEGLAPGGPSRLRQLARARSADAVILQRKLLGPAEFALLRRSARRLVFELDDAVFLRDSYHPRGESSLRRWSRFARIARGADLVIAGNDFLEARAIRAGADPARVLRIPTCVDPSRYPTRRHEAAPELRLAWIGSSSTLRGIASQRLLWERLAGEIPGLRLRLICDRSVDLGPLPVEFVPWSEAIEAGALAGADVGIAWVPDDSWSRGKCGLKVLQYFAAGLPVVANPVGVHLEQIAHGRSGFLHDDADGWVSAIKALAIDPEARARMGRAARETVEQSYAVDRWADRFVNAVRGVPDDPEGRARSHAPLGLRLDAARRNRPEGRVERMGR